MHTRIASFGRVVVVRFDNGDDLLSGLRAAVREHGIENGVFLGAIGSISSYHYHVVASAELPPEEAFPRGEGAYDILTITGAVLAGRVHAHITFSDAERAQGGHLEEGCRVLTFSMVTLAELPAVDLGGWDKMGQL